MSLNEPRYSHAGSGRRAEIVEGIMRTSGDHGLHGDLRYWPVPELVALDLPGGMGFVDALRAIWDTGDAAAPLDPRLPPSRAHDAARRAAPDPDRRLRRGAARTRRRHPGRGGRRPGRRDVGHVGSAQGRRAHPRRHRRLGRGRRRPGSASTPPVTPGWPACRWRTSAGSSVVTRSIVTGTPLVVLPGFEAEAVEEAGRSGRVTHVSLVATALQTARSLGLRLRAPRRQQGSRRRCPPTSCPPTA